MARPFFALVVVVLAVLASFSFAKPRTHSPALVASRTASAIQARQLTLERLLNRADRTAMSNLFGRVDCSIPQPSTLACPCGSEYELCGPACRDLQGDPDNCGTCEHTCSGSNPGCCEGECADFTSWETCGSCLNQCNVDLNEACCDGTCANLFANQDHCGACGTPCASNQGCCGAQCVDIENNNDHCGACLSVCDGVCVNSTCYIP
ncbi:hypothetical protein EXIGLDRAFT_421213 [Exidia glandulosa HHB12029]|uniref:Stig1-domain-containing protein n=1 Tax=Exidia glandulosa HHB12029 TaxID=1314781 RepID=A0A165KMR3_EXIGL|nr:hypothetical protein EXIGLDRAFT_421213 [Exidia glandulosa HHB12029]